MVASALLLMTLGASGDFDAIVNGVSERSHDESCRLIQQFTQDPLKARRGVVWCARLLWADGRLDDARVLLEPIAIADDEPAMQAVSTLMDIHLTQGRYARAAEFSRRLAASQVELWRYTGNQAAIEIERAQRLWWQAVVVCALLGLWLALRAWTVGKSLWPIPAEVWVLAPLLGLLLGIAVTQSHAVAGALASLVIGSVALAWINGAFWRARPPLGKTAALEAFKGLAQGVLWLDVVLVGSGLWRPLWQSALEGFS